MKRNIIVCILIILTIFRINAQDHKNHGEIEPLGKGFRVVGIIGHTLVNNEGLDNVFVPSWGLDFEYWFNHNWGIGLHNDVEIETFVIKKSENEEIERVNPLVLTLDALYQFANGFVITLGPGIELEKKESFYLFRVGIEYEKDISQSFYILPNLFLDQRFDGYNTWNIGLGIGMRL
ncbi:hypothetical protein [Winogradskyella alexanderae]|uniref:Outer membrane protein beta-barrel domain-containing protein n=1 Tax=Winogradskyella alexanderae TaxID=2877123 RepID=A0ABS7XU19_9FLAO|nr:hypothetical protein [Winogradskyella alexanderae]MCA0133527.1 hypothetical protein [Winogradskyella alexanderae]